MAVPSWSRPVTGVRVGEGAASRQASPGIGSQDFRHSVAAGVEGVVGLGTLGVAGNSFSPLLLSETHYYDPTLLSTEIKQNNTRIKIRVKIISTKLKLT